MWSWSWPVAPRLEEGFQIFQGDVFPAGDEFGFQLVLSGDLGLTLQAGEDFEDDLGLEFGVKDGRRRLGIGGRSW